MKTVLSAILLCALATTLQAQKVKVKVTQGVDFSQYRTYALVQGQPVIQPTLNDYIKLAILTELENRGWKPADAKHADVLVAYYAAFDNEISFGSLIDPGYILYGYAATTDFPVWASQAATGSTTYVHKGSLQIRVYDGKYHAPIYIGEADGYAAGTNPRVLKQIDKVLPKMMAELPTVAN